MFNQDGSSASSDANYNGTDSFAFRGDGTVDSNVATVAIL